MKRVFIFCLPVLLGIFGHGFPTEADAQLSKVTLLHPIGTNIITPSSEEYTTGDSMDIVWEDEHLVSGQDFVVRWASPTENYYNKKNFRLNEYYTLKYSFDKISWKTIGNANKITVYEHLWSVPIVSKSKRCWLKVIGFDANGQKNGTDTRLVYIRVKPAVNVNISYSANGGETWRSIAPVPYGGSNQYGWTVSMKSRRCRFTGEVKVVMKDGDGKAVGSAVSTPFTVISDQPPRLSGNWSGLYYSKPSGTIPVSGTIDSENGYNFIGELPFGKAKFKGKFSGNCINADDDGTLAIKGDGTAYAPAGHVWDYTGERTAAIDLDADTNAAMTKMMGTWKMSGNLDGDFAIDRE